MHTIRIQFDGGCKNQGGTKGNWGGDMYGSFAVFMDERKSEVQSRINFGKGTNNDAEWAALYAALVWVDEKFSNTKSIRSNFNLLINSDSQIVVLKLNSIHSCGKSYDAILDKHIKAIAKKTRPDKKRASERSLAMSEWGIKCHRIFSKFHQPTAVWIPRERNVELFGH